MNEVVNKLISLNKSISTMESCTGGYIANMITNVSGSSEVFMFGAVTYSNEYKIKLGVSENVIEEYSVYSMECAREMSKSISLYTNSDYGVGVTGKLNRVDKNNLYGLDNVVFISVYDKSNDKFYNKEITVSKNTRELNKEEVCEEIVNILKNIMC